MPKIVQYRAEVIPARHFIRLIRGVILRDVAVVDMTFDMLWLIAFTPLVGLMIAALRFKKRSISYEFLRINSR
jgi:ABC-2 type transport system permease protein